MKAAINSRKIFRQTLRPPKACRRWTTPILITCLSLVSYAQQTTPGWVRQSNAFVNSFGTSLANAGDVNGDGYDDVIIGSRGYDSGSLFQEGKASLYYGSPCGLEQDPAWEYASGQAGAELGWSVDGAGDVNGDGYADIIVGAKHYDNGQTDEGRAFLFHGGPAGPSATPDWIVEGDVQNCFMGYEVAGAGDVNNDGFDDVIVSAHGCGNTEQYEGMVFAYYGSAAGLSVIPSWSYESNIAYEFYGASVAGAGDVNGDGYDDVVVGAYSYGGWNDYGHVDVFYGSLTGLPALPSWGIDGTQNNSYFGWDVNTAGDVNGDGYDDVIVGTYLWANGNMDEGAAWVYHGSATGLPATHNWMAEGNANFATFGYCVSTAGDMNGDGYDEVVVGAPDYGIVGAYGDGKAFAFTGSAGGLSTNYTWDDNSPIMNSEFGWSVSTCGDINGDNFDDMIIGAWHYTCGENREGEVYVYYGGTQAVLQADILPSIQNCGDTTICIGDNIPLMGNPTGGNPAYSHLWTGDGGGFNQNNIIDPVFTAPANGTYHLVYEVTDQNGCSSRDSITVIVTAPDASFNGPTTFCAGDPPQDFVPVTTGGTFSGTGITDAVNGTFDPVTAGLGTHDIIYTLSGSCANADTLQVLVTNGANATITPPLSFCSDDGSTIILAADPGGIWAGVGIIDAGAGIFDPAAAGPGAHTVTYSIAGACGDQDSVVVQVTAAADATINPPQVFCINDLPTNLVAQDLGGIWSGPGIVDPVNGSFDPNNSGVGTHQIIYTINGQCGDADTVNVFVNASFDATIVSPTTWCLNDPADTLWAVDQTGVWSGNGITDMLTGAFDPQVAGVGTHQIIHDAQGLCGDADTVMITITAPANTTITPAGPFCENDLPQLLTAVDPNGTWSGTGIINSNTGEFDPNLAGTGTFWVTYTIAGNCGNMDSIQIQVDAFQSASIDPAGPFCSSDLPVTLTASAPGGTWNGPGITDALAGTFDPATAGTGSHEVIYGFTGNCAAGDTLTIVVTPSGDATITSVAALCEDAPALQLTAATGGGTWTGNGVINNVSGTFDPATTGAGTHTILYSIPGACGAADSTTITVHALPEISLSADVLEGCEALEVTFTGTINPTAAGHTCEWNFGDGTQTAGCGQVTHTYNASGNYLVAYAVTSPEGCVATASLATDIVVHPTPEASFDVSSSTIVVGDEVDLINNSTNADTWDWQVNSQSISNDFSPTHTFNLIGEHSVLLIASNAFGCIDSAMLWLEVETDFTLYVPNAFTPDGDGLNDVFLPIIDEHHRDDYMLLIYNRWGQVIYSADNASVGWDGYGKGNRPVQDGVYVWKLIFSGDYPTVETAFTGHVTVVK